MTKNVLKWKDALGNIHAKQSLISSYKHTDTNASVKHTSNSKNKSSLKLHLQSYSWSSCFSGGPEDLQSYV